MKKEAEATVKQTIRRARGELIQNCCVLLSYLKEQSEEEGEIEKEKEERSEI